MKPLLFLISSALWLHAETGYDAWLRYATVKTARPLPAAVFVAGESKPLTAARDEVVRGVRGMTARTLRIESSLPKEDAIVLGPIDEMRRVLPQSGWNQPLDPDAFWLRTVTSGGMKYIVVTGGSDRGVLYVRILRCSAGLHPANRSQALDEKQTLYARSLGQPVGQPRRIN